MLSAELRAQIAVIDRWLLPSVAEQVARHDAAKLRILRRTLADIAERMAEAEGEVPAGEPLSASLEALAESFAGWRDCATFERPAIIAIVALLNEAAASARAIEVCLRRVAGVTLPEDLPALRLAAALHRRGVTVGGSAPAPAGGGDAA